MRYTKKVSIWPVGLAGGLKAEGPRCKNGKVTSWHVGWSPDRKFPVDMAGKIDPTSIHSFNLYCSICG